MKKLCLAFVLTGLLFPSVAKADQLKENISQAVMLADVEINLSAEGARFLKDIEDFRNAATSYLNNQDSKFLKANPQYATPQAKVNHIVQQMWTGGMMDTYKAVKAKMPARERFALLNYLASPLNTNNGKFFLRPFLHDNLSLCTHASNIVPDTTAFLNDMETAELLQDIDTFRGRLASHLDGLKSQFYKDNPQLASREAEANFISQMLVIDVMDRFQEVKPAKTDRTLLLRYLNAPLGKTKFVLSDFWAKNKTFCGHQEFIINQVDAFVNEINEAMK